jgi:5-keto 4-deoxyuronate isomerase
MDKILLGGITATNELILINRESGISEITPQPLYSKKDFSVLNIDKTKCRFAYLDTTGVVKMLDKDYKITDAQLIGMPYQNVLFDDITGEGINHFITLDSKNIAAYTQENTELFQYPLPREGAEKLMLMNTENNEKFMLYTTTGNGSIS